MQNIKVVILSAKSSLTIYDSHFMVHICRKDRYSFGITQTNNPRKSNILFIFIDFGILTSHKSMQKLEETEKRIDEMKK